VKLPGFFSVTVLFFCLNLWTALPVEAQKPVSDSTVESLMNQFSYHEASNLISAKLNNTPGLKIDERLYYANRQSIAQLKLRNIDSALMIALVAISLSEKSTDSTLIVDAWKSAAYVYNNAGKLDSALFFTRKMMLYGERNGDEKLLRNAIISIAAILSQNNRYDEALHHYRDAYLLTLKLNDSVNFLTCKYNLGLTFLNLNQTDSCLFYLFQAADLSKKHQHNDNLIYIYGTIADCYLLMKNEKEQKKYLLLANEIAERIDNKQFLAMGFSNLTTGAIESGNFAEALVYGQKALDMLKKQPYQVLNIKVDSLMYIANKALGRFPEADKYLEMYFRGKEKLVSERQQEKLNELVTNLQVREKNLTIANQQLELTRKQRNVQLLLLVVFIILLLAIGQFVYTLKTRRFRRELFKKEKDLDQQIVEIHTWMEWKYNKEVSGKEDFERSIVADERLNDKMILSEQNLLFIELREVFDSQKVYLDPELNINTVIKILGTNRKYLYQAITENSDSNFRNFINRYRVDEAKKIIEQKIRMKDEWNLSEIYASAGFNSPVSFYRAFKLVTGLTPKEYAIEAYKELKKLNMRML
jgi:AraC-like DNA-binding protein